MPFATGFNGSAGSAIYDRCDLAAQHYIRTGALPDDLDSLLSFLVCEQRRFRWSAQGDEYDDPNRRFVDALLGVIRAHLMSYRPVSGRGFGSHRVTAFRTGGRLWTIRRSHTPGTSPASTTPLHVDGVRLAVTGEFGSSA